MYLSEAQVTTEACFFKKRRSPNKRWHRVLRYYPKARTHIAYCGQLEVVNQTKLTYAGEWNASDEKLLADWKDCRKCEWYYNSNPQPVTDETDSSL